MSGAREAYERIVQLYNAGDLEGLVKCFTEDGVLVTPFGAAQGRAAILEAWGRSKAAFPDDSVAIDVVVEQGDTVASEYTWAGTHTGPLTMPDGTEVPPTGKRAECKCMDLVHVRDGRLAMHHMYYDSMAVIGQLGLLPDGAST
jgi:predicted ester cyclase